MLIFFYYQNKDEVLKNFKYMNDMISNKYGFDLPVDMSKGVQGEERLLQETK